MQKIKKIYNSNFFFYSISIIILILISIIQIFPDNYFFASGDASQIVSFKTWFFNNNSAWSDSSIEAGGLGIHNTYLFEVPYYFLINFFSEFLKLNIGHQSALHHFFFYFFSYLSITYYLRSSFNFLNLFEQHVIAFSYVINIVVYYVYFYTWGYTPFYFVYIFIPLFFAIIDNFYKQNNFKSIVLYALKIAPIVVISNVCFKNSAFLLSLFFILNLYLFFNLFSQSNRIKKNLVVSIIFNILFILSLSPSLYGLILYLDANEARDLIWNPLAWVKGQAAYLPNPFFLFDGYQLIKKNNFVSFQYLFFGFIIILILIDVLKNKRNLQKNFDYKKIFFLFLLILLIFIHNKGIDFLNDDQIYSIFVNSFYYIFRSSDKIIVYYPFVSIVLILLLTNYFKSRIKIFVLILFFNSLVSFPLLTGGIKTNYDLAVGEKENFKKSEYAMIKKFSKDYKNISNYLNQKEDFVKYGILNLPFSGISSPNWSTYQKNQHVGLDPYTQFFIHRMISLNDWGTKGMDFIGRSWNFSNENQDWYKKIFKLFPIKYIIFHKDVHDFLYEESIGKIIKLENDGILGKIYEGKQLVLYEIINKNFSNEIINLPENMIKTNFKSHSKFSKVLENNKDTTSKNYVIKFGEINYYNYEEYTLNKQFNKKFKIFEKDQENNTKIVNFNVEDAKIKYEKINSSRYKINISNLKKETIVISFLQAYSKNWKINNKEKNFKLIEHFKCNGYANCYEIISKNKSISLEINYMPQSLFKMMLIIPSILIFVGIFVNLKLRQNET